jgi:hypothetical protein
MKEGRGFAFLLNMKKIAPWKKWCLSEVEILNPQVKL